MATHVCFYLCATQNPHTNATHFACRWIGLRYNSFGILLCCVLICEKKIFVENFLKNCHDNDDALDSNIHWPKMRAVLQHVDQISDGQSS